MAIYRTLGNALVSQDEYRRLVTTEQSVATLTAGRELKIGDSVVSLAAIQQGTAPFTPIGLNKPLTVQIRHVYTGRFPKRRRNMLVTSAMKSLAQFDAAPRAINFMTDPVAARTGVSAPAATDRGTPLVYYSPALTKGASVVTLEFGFDDFDPSFIEGVGSLLKGAAGIPAFVAASPYLIGAGSILKLAAGIAARFLEKGPVFKDTDPIDFVTPGSTLPDAGFRVMTETGFPHTVLATHAPDSGGILVDSQGQPYRGDWPYVTISLDGAEVKEYAAFEPTQASAAILQDFFNIRDEQDAPLGAMLEGLKLYNDLKFRLEADEVKKQLSALPPDSPEATRLQERYDALKKNILEPALQP